MLEQQDVALLRSDNEDAKRQSDCFGLGMNTMTAPPEGHFRAHRPLRANMFEGVKFWSKGAHLQATKCIQHSIAENWTVFRLPVCSQWTATGGATKSGGPVHASCTLG